MGSSLVLRNRLVNDEEDVLLIFLRSLSSQELFVLCHVLTEGFKSSLNDSKGIFGSLREDILLGYCSAIEDFSHAMVDLWKYKEQFS